MGGADDVMVEGKRDGRGVDGAKYAMSKVTLFFKIGTYVHISS